MVRASSGGGGGGGYSAPVTQVTKTGSTAGTGSVSTSPTTKMYVKNSDDPYAAALEISKASALAKLPKSANSKNVPEGMKPKIDRLVVERIVKSLNIDGKTGEAKSAALAKASASVAKLAKAKTK
ncbi:MAG: hypothetical protein QMC36_07225 [Patescibacteria group bacterium]